MGVPVIHFEIGCRDQARTTKFYTELFGWKTQQYGDVSMVDTGAGSGIHGHISSLGHEPHHYITVYVEVDDLQKYLDRAEELGGKTLVPPTEVPGAGHFAWMADPDGTPFGLWKSAPQAQA